jgi:hypothetical protein
MEKFYSVVRIFYKGSNETHSIEIKSTLLDARKRYFNIIATDLANEEITYQAAYIIDSNGLMVEGRVFDRTHVTGSEAAYENA